jgi:hypothetical protein
MNSPTEPFATAGVASAEEGQVLLDGPDGIAITLTAEAALATGKSLIEAAGQAHAQREASGKPGEGIDSPDN